MNATRGNLADYLTALKHGRLGDTAKPFDTASNDLMAFGEQAEALVLPEWSLEQITPPDPQMIENIYKALKPVLKELQHNAAFDSEAEYAGLKADALSKAYLLSVVNKKTVQNNGRMVTRDVLAYQDFLRHCSDALVDNISSHHALEHFSKYSEVQASFDTIIKNMTLSYPDKQALITYYQSMQLFSMAYKTSLFDDQDLEQALSCQVKDSIQASYELVYGKKSDMKQTFYGADSKLVDKSELEKSSFLGDLLNQMNDVLEDSLNHHSENVLMKLLMTLKRAPFFMKSIPELSETADTTTFQSYIQNLQLAIRAAISYLEGQKEQKRWIMAQHAVDSNVIQLNVGQHRE